MRGLKDKVVIITGGAGGIGAALSARFAAEGSKVAIFDLNAASADEVVEGIKTNGGTAIGCAVDITDHDAVNEAVARIEATLGPVDVLVNNAGWDHADRFVNTTPALWQKLISINLVGPLNLHHAVLKGMLERGHGRIVNIASDAGRVGSSGESVYSACKGGIIAFTKTIARETARKKINVNVVCPGPTDTALFKDFAGEGESGDKLRGALEKAIPFGRLGQPEDVVGAVCFLASDDASFITGQVISVSGGLTMAG
ncbi:glucose 1-dehydrogenase [Pigmentiphaga sp. GD03639]|uniref:glucose 1-dehydrogenase n=1 Tax=unclassified Pigmentiphaga TaxID=2626614 RepID=UPI000B411383|nr:MULTISPECIES: glucose 1-dehydrogenase [unclassified Pigmentiphaga]MDH2237141.1 glucose 1-dehydrogenase [Pigmentiphaga sp. GD03639]OVZ65806.1 2-hydroxycyclohexanecarboxyl-CoA dehydrogenase [Pigmentiphaga sp. NML030171]